MKPVDFVYVFADIGVWDELKYSLRSLETNFQGEFNVWIVGDKPKWLSNHTNYIYHGRDVCSKFLDSVDKIKLIMADERIGDDFVYMSDDVYLVNPVSIQDIDQFYAVQDLKGRPVHKRKRTTNHVRKIWQTMDALTAKDCPNYNSETHMPRYFNKKKLQQIFDEFDVVNRRLLFPTLYYNWHYKHEKATILQKQDAIKAGFYNGDSHHSISFARKKNERQLIWDLLATKKFLNHNNAGLSDAMKTVIRTRFPNKSRFEC